MINIHGRIELEVVRISSTTEICQNIFQIAQILSREPSVLQTGQKMNSFTKMIKPLHCSKNNQTTALQQK